MRPPATIHGSAVLLGETGILIRGVSGSGKSTLLLDLLAADPGGARLVADDRVMITAVNARILADVPAAIAGMVEMRGVGLLSQPYVAPVVIRLVVDLASPDACPRLLEAEEAETVLEGVRLPRLFVPIGVAGAWRMVRTASARFATGRG